VTKYFTKSKPVITVKAPLALRHQGSRSFRRGEGYLICEGRHLRPLRGLYSGRTSPSVARADHAAMTVREVAGWKRNL